MSLCTKDPFNFGLGPMDWLSGEVREIQTSILLNQLNCAMLESDIEASDGNKSKEIIRNM